MKLKLFKILFFSSLLIITGESFGQLSQNGWSFGFGGTYPRFMSITGSAYSGNTNFGGYLSIERNFSEHIALRLKSGIYHLESFYHKNNVLTNQKVNAFTGDIDLLYSILPCEIISPIVTAGGGFVGSKSQNSFNNELNNFVSGYEINFGIGAYWNISSIWKLKTEINYHTLSHNKLDGNYSINQQNKGIFGGNGDTYMTFEIGLVWQFSQGEKSTLCEKTPSGIKEIIKIDTVYKEVPKEVIKIERDTVYMEKPILVNVNFDFDKSNIRVESTPILKHTIKVLNQNPDLKIVISGYTDNIGSDEYNQKLSERRVNSVFKYLISKGIDKDRITKKAFGEKFPIKENNSSLNRSFNRRVEFKIVE